MERAEQIKEILDSGEDSKQEGAGGAGAARYVDIFENGCVF